MIPPPDAEDGASWPAAAAFYLGVVGAAVSGIGVIAVFSEILTGSGTDAYYGVSVGLVSILGSAPAVILGAIGLYETARHPARTGRRKAAVGLLLGAVGVALWWLVVGAAAAMTA